MEKEQIQQIVNILTEKVDLYDKPIKEKWESTFPDYPLTVSPILCIVGFLFAYIVIVPIIRKFISNIKNSLNLGQRKYEEDMIYLHKYGNVDQYLPSLSPFCLKLEAYLRFASLKYTVVSKPNFDLAPKGKLPFIERNGEIYDDSSFIINWINDQIDFDPDATLVSDEKAIALATKRLLEDHLYFIIMRQRWLTKDGYKFTKTCFKDIPCFVKPFVLRKIRNNIKNTLYLQGIGRFSDDELYEIANEDIKCLSNLLGESEYIFGTQEPTSLDIYVFSFIASIIQLPYDYPLKTLVMNRRNLVNHCKRIGHLYFQEYDWDFE
ncbi:hypothetical protein H8356DRAFT_1622930 [Neocallimastix lanati (nom. inval.)]|jgi:hypothetical protein|uniref:Thioredoxin-like fold domain-containing protein n=1 Tax=Neocallimastix californiae TaxID=1754190 RepID=A0A1Y2AGC7_9FUNG|nr:hypothetical protein H8356DRAFT_1622930 [Neocallimastix sp. JGI-2020a]ORY21267.1 hypothetical protein LY90DRAFT_463513 [Neocallimastix californiae]|eukprot:ORY21267.1 hypothetical protein LY90DRAFT_463513 [Neocallimastix californiae]